MKNKLTSKIRNKIILTTVFVALLCIIIIGGHAYWVTSNLLQEEVTEQELSKLDNLAAGIYGFLIGLEQDVLYLSKSNTLNQYLQAVEAQDSAVDIASKRDAAEEDFFVFAQARGIYDQIRFIDATGQEIIRINTDPITGQVNTVSADQLQNKANRYYFSDTAKLSKGEVFISSLDLNREQGEIEVLADGSYKPVIRYGTPVVIEGETVGVIVTNVLANGFLAPLFAVNENLFLVDQDGYFICYTAEPHCWGRDLETGITILNHYPPHVGEKLFYGAPGSIIDNGTFFAYRFFQISQYTPMIWHIGAAEPQDTVFKQVFDFVYSAQAVALLALFVAVIAAMILARALTAPIVELNKAALQVAEGNFDLNITPTTNDEIGSLAEAFNIMASQVLDLITTLEDRVRERTRRLELVATLSERLSTILSQDELLIELVTQLQENLGYYHAHVYLLDDGGDHLVFAAGSGESGRTVLINTYTIPLADPTSSVSQVARTHELMIIDDMRQRPHWQPNPLFPDSSSKIAVPIIATLNLSHQRKTIGVLVVHQNTVSGLDASDADLLRSLASHVATDLTNVRLFETTQANLSKTENQYHISRRVMSTTNLSEVLEAIVESLDLPVIVRAILLMSEYNDKGEVKAMLLQASWYSGQGTAPRPLGTRYDWPRDTVITMSLTTAPLYFDDIQNDTRVSEGAIIGARERNIGAMIILPLVRHGQQNAVCMLIGEQPYSFTGKELRPYFSLVGQLSVSVENHYLLEQTQQRAAELVVAKETLTKLNADKDKFFSIVAHDLKGPFMPVLGNAELLVDLAGELSPNELKTISQSIYRSAKNTLNLLENLLQWSRMQMGHMEYQPEPILLRDVVQQTMEVLYITAEAKQITLESTVPETLMVCADVYMIDTVIRNLVNNALKFTPAEGQVTIYSQEQEFLNADQIGYTEVIIKDTGVGISSEAIDKLFKINVHHSTEGTANERGTGLGLILCKEMVEINGGEIWVDSVLGEGTSVKFTVPIVKESINQSNPIWR
ncbi:ATP-binding protein [Anaerolineales bacterium HSG25]|nr:ATP-binding protein [Anaerolineales bacterium HSG25]